MTDDKPRRLGVILVPNRDGKVYTIVPYDVGQAGIAFVRDQLQQTSPLSQRVMDSWGDRGTAIAPAPVGTPMERIYSFEGGAFMGQGASDKWVGDYIKSQWGADVQFVFVDPWIPIDDRIIHPPNYSYFLTGKIIHFMPEASDHVGLLEAAYGECRSFLLIGFIVHPPVPLPAWGEQADPRMIDAIARNTQAVLISAYDRDGYVIWQK